MSPVAVTLATSSGPRTTVVNGLVIAAGPEIAMPGNASLIE
jgi:hypothetical protein